jgi:hypothetical protein
MSGFGRRIRPHVQFELAAADACAAKGDFSASFAHLERAHVLGQSSTREHVRVHWRMLLWGFHQRKSREVAGQMFRILGAAMTTALGLVPEGNTGGANVGPLRRMDIPRDLAALIANARESR